MNEKASKCTEHKFRNATAAVAGLYCERRGQYTFCSVSDIREQIPPLMGWNKIPKLLKQKKQRQWANKMLGSLTTFRGGNDQQVAAMVGQLTGLITIEL